MEARAAACEGRISSSSSKDEALKCAISAIEMYMKAIKLANGAGERDRLKSKCKLVLAKAEEIKQMKHWSPTNQSQHTSNVVPVSVLKAPISERALSTREEIILLENSKLNGVVFPQWRSDPAPAEFGIIDNVEIYSDSSDMSISAEQGMTFAGWQRPYEALSHHYTDGSQEEHVEPTMLPVRTIDLVQDVAADCSVVASLCAAVARPQDGFNQILQSIFYPHDVTNGKPVLSKNGKYIFRLHFNGCFRKVVIDDRLPASKTSRALHVLDRQNPSLLWPALLEKAYLKVRGGYDFPGSNSGTDLWVLTGWIPEQIFLQSDELSPGDLWDRVRRSFGFGDVILTLGTGRLSPLEEEEFGLAGEHDYAVLDMKEIGSQRLLLVKNPWCDGMVWKGASPKIPDQLKVVNNWTDELRESLEESSILPSGTFWIAFEEVIRNFESLYLNWNPGLFRYRQDHHFAWTIPSLISPGWFTHNPQYSVRSISAGTVWILLSRHFNSQESTLLASSTAESNSGTGSVLGFISLYVFDTDGYRIHLSDNAMIRGPFVDSPQTLVRFDMPANSCYTLAVAHLELPLPKYSFTISAYSRDPVIVSEAQSSYAYSTVANGAWTARTSGGNASSPSYPSNPQFSISLQCPTEITILLEASRLELAVHVEMVWADGERVTAVTAKDILAESGEYRRGCALVKIPKVPAGIYTIVCSTFEAGQTGKFTLRVESTIPCTLKAVIGEDAGRLSSRLPILQLRHDFERSLAPIKVSRMTRLSVVARHTGTFDTHGRPGSKSSIKITLERGQGPHKTILSSSNGGDFSDSPTGVRITDIDIGPETAGREGVWLVVERFGGGELVDNIAVELLSESPVVFGLWGSGDG